MISPILCLLLACLVSFVRAAHGGGDSADLIEMNYWHAIPIAGVCCGILAAIFFVLHWYNAKQAKTGGHH